MTREIKFRAWDKEQKEMRFGKMEKGNIIWNGFLMNNAENTTMQFTGLKDKNEKEIYEGDILRFKFQGQEGIGKVIFTELKGLFQVKCFDTTLPMWCDLYFKEVIGNIYENPELLEVEK